MILEELDFRISLCAKRVSERRAGESVTGAVFQARSTIRVQTGSAGFKNFSMNNGTLGVPVKALLKLPTARSSWKEKCSLDRTDG
jgi:hypothetical protein